MWPTPNLIRRASEGLSSGARKAVAVSNYDKWLKLYVALSRGNCFKPVAKSPVPLRVFLRNPLARRLYNPIVLIPVGGIDCVKW